MVMCAYLLPVNLPQTFKGTLTIPLVSVSFFSVGGAKLDNMQEVWIKKTIYRRYLVTNKDLKEVKAILEHDPERADELIRDIYDRNKNIEYDEEKLILPIDYSISAVANER